MDEAEAERRVGTTVGGKWTLQQLLGVGGMAAAYVAVHKIGRREAIKILHPVHVKSPTVRERFEREARAVNMLSHPAIVEIRDIDKTAEGLPFLVMELVEGKPLADHVGHGADVDLDELLRCVDQLLDGLAAAHDRGIVHRDIKPDNLMVGHDGQLKVLDFGIARIEKRTAGELRTKTGATIGTITYMSPEQIRGAGIDGRADLFSVGATMFRLVSGRRIHVGAGSDGDMLIKMATEPAPPLVSVAPDAPVAVGQVVDRALQLQRDRRYPDAMSMQQDVRRVLRGEPPAVALAELAADAEREAPTRRVGAGAGGTAALKQVAEPTSEELPSVSHADPTPGSATQPRTVASGEPTSTLVAPGEAPPLSETLQQERLPAKPAARLTVLGRLIRWGMILLGVGMMLLGAFYAPGLIISRAVEDEAMAGFDWPEIIFSSTFFALLGGSGWYCARAGWRRGRPRKPDAKAMRLVQEYARSHGSKISPAKLAMDTPLSLTDAAAVLDAMTEAGACTIVSNRQGQVLYLLTPSPASADATADSA